ncbi:hypothetical protein BRADI_3g28630v3 [Brachypodium distachyon]|uniref:Ubiquitin-like protease family profile domain-containing protein n=1 Tax=Brachypodium distachyon TaxID=15368 RepID=A0A0Q3FFZ8_BRADI|nr:hypothetical protein BRADI_3g28630v3 [Brachypodium distachyon]
MGDTSRRDREHGLAAVGGEWGCRQAARPQGSSGTQRDGERKKKGTISATATSAAARTRTRVATADHEDEEEIRHAKKSQHSHSSSCTTSPLDAVPEIKSCSRYPARRRVQAPAPLVVSDRTLREAATLAYIIRAARHDKNDTNTDKNNTHKLLVSSERPHVRLRADALRPLAVPLSRDGPERKISGPVMDASVELLRRRLLQAAGNEQGTILRNGRRVLLLGVEEQDWLQYLGSSSLRPSPTTPPDHQNMTSTARHYLEHDVVFFLVNHEEHFFVAALDVGKGEYRVLDAGNYAARGDDDARAYYDRALARIRDGVARCMEAAGRPAPCQDGGWGMVRVEEGLPEQTDESSCGLFALKWMELWDGEKLERGFDMDEVHALRASLAEELVFSEMNEMRGVKEEIEWMMM